MGEMVSGIPRRYRVIVAVGKCLLLGMVTCTAGFTGLMTWLLFSRKE